MTSVRLLTVLLAALLGALLSGVVGPRTPELGPAGTGDAQLAADVRASLVDDHGYQSLSVVRVRAGRISYAGLGSSDGTPPGPQTPFELGSITKTFTGLLLADAVRRGELRLTDRLASHLPELRGTDVGDVTLVELATHSGGLPPLPPALKVSGALRTLGNENPYGSFSTADLLSAARDVRVTGRGQYRYSNLGVSLLGHAEARAAGVSDWPRLAANRLWRPLGMTATRVARSPGDVPRTTAGPHRDNGWRAPYWSGPAFAPAGSSTWTTAADMGRYARALLARRVPGADALTPVREARSGRIGLVWQISPRSGRTITWHNGATGGYHSTLALDLARRQAVVVLGNSSRAADRATLALAATAPQATVAPVDAVPFRPAGLVWPAVGLLLLGQGAWQSVRGRHRLELVSGVLTGVSGLLVLGGYGPWALVPGWLWGAAAGVIAATTVFAVLRARRLPTLPARRRALAWLSLLSAVAGAALAAWLL